MPSTFYFYFNACLYYWHKLQEKFSEMSYLSFKISLKVIKSYSKNYSKKRSTFFKLLNYTVHKEKEHKCEYIISRNKKF